MNGSHDNDLCRRRARSLSALADTLKERWGWLGGLEGGVVMEGRAVRTTDIRKREHMDRIACDESIHTTPGEQIFFSVCEIWQRH